ncbi:hypothetical protein COCCADRAFT_108716, partial [Bipolaris zeicola 26-R-13]
RRPRWNLVVELRQLPFPRALIPPDRLTHRNHKYNHPHRNNPPSGRTKTQSSRPLCILQEQPAPSTSGWP